MVVGHLGNTSFDVLMTCFLKSFENYYVTMPQDPTYYQKRWEAANVDYRLSYGMFENDQLVGFILHGIDQRWGEKIAYNTGTGVLPEFRGRRIVKAIYETCLPELRDHQIRKATLEVIKKNHRAIKSYESIGFAICRDYKCFKGEILADAAFEGSLREVTYTEVDWEALPHQKNYSWDSHKNSIQGGNYRFFIIEKDGVQASYFIINWASGYIAQLGCFIESEYHWALLFAGIKKVSSQVTINNVDERLTKKIEHIERAGLINTVDQYEMELALQELQ